MLQKKTKRLCLAVALVAAFLVLSLVAFYVVTYVSVNGTYMIIGNTKFSSIDYEYFYHEYANNFIETDYSILDYVGLQTDVDYDKQVYDEETGETWEDFFQEETIEDLKEKTAFYEEAEKNNFKVEEEKLTLYITSKKEELEELAKENDVTLDQYISYVYIKGATFEDLENAITIEFISEQYESSLYSGFSYTEEDIEEKYNSAREDYDTVSYRMFGFRVVDYANHISESSSEDDEELTDDEIIDLADEQAKEDANSFFDEALTEDDFKELCIEYATNDWFTVNEYLEDYEDNDASLYENETYDDALYPAVEWLFDEEREYGNACIVYDDTDMVYLVIFFVGRQKNTEATVNYRQIFIPYDISTATSTDEEIEEYKEEVNKETNVLFEKCKSISEEEFSTLANEKSYDSNTNTNGGLCEDVSYDTVPKVLKDWVFDEERITGDVELISSDMGCFILMFLEKEDETWRSLVISDLKDDYYNDNLGEIDLDLKVEDVKGEIYYI